ncbi:hypothetical protein TNIN_301241 [Trichonephila inaurata madagascariensis]|uniref:Uncharacterized protein n=1 Tax=Trichonephila inaurata madagascariensis TaxID=2747483 RepID=A0A8X7C5R1_9ARAC|nr:hypothetical protein TNIN_301241 [Trichonephila inaurata madagascariensis]
MISSIHGQPFRQPPMKLPIKIESNSKVQLSVINFESGLRLIACSLSGSFGCHDLLCGLWFQERIGCFRNISDPFVFIFEAIASGLVYSSIRRQVYEVKIINTKIKVT